jgi:hypothetical protein
LLRSHASITRRTLTGSATGAASLRDHALVLTDHWARALATPLAGVTRPVASPQVKG